MSKLSSIAGKIIPGFFVVLGLSSVLYPPLFGAVVGFSELQWWKVIDGGKTSLTCGGSQSMTIRGEKIALQPADMNGLFMGEYISAGGNCTLHLIDCDLTAPNVIEAGGGAHVLIEGGHITGTKHAISVGGSAIVEVRGTQIDGDVSGNANQLVGITAGKHSAGS